MTNSSNPNGGAESRALLRPATQRMLHDEQDELLLIADILIESGFDFHGQYLVLPGVRPPTTQKFALRLRGVLPSHARRPPHDKDSGVSVHTTSYNSLSSST